MTLTLYRMPASALHEAGGDPDAIGALLDADHPQLDLDKGWNGLQFLLTGDTYLTTGLGAALMGGDEVGDDLGYGPARWLTPAEVAAVSEELAGADIDALRADWTNRDPRITAELARYQRSAVPFNVIWQPGRAEPVILPELLTPGIVLDALGR